MFTNDCCRTMRASKRPGNRFGRWSFALFLFSVACDGGDCENETIREEATADRSRRAVVFHRSCGGNAGFSTHVTLVAGDAALPDSVGNTFIANTNQGTAPAGPHGGPAIAVRWVATDTLEVRYHPHARVFVSTPRVGDVEIRYVIDPRAALALPPGTSQ
jgi:hypothetical protein